MRFIPGRVLVGMALVAAVVVGCGGGEGATAATATPAETGPGASNTPDTQEVRMAQAGDNVSVHYRGTLDSGEEFDSSRGREPLTFTLGAGEVISGFDDAITGMAVGETKTVRIPAEEAYGMPREDLVLVVPAAQAPEGLEVGQQVFLGNTPATVVQIDTAGVTVDANHPLAGEALTFEVELVSIN